MTAGEAPEGCFWDVFFTVFLVVCVDLDPAWCVGEGAASVCGFDV